MTTAAIRYLGQDYTYPVLAAEQLVNDRVIDLHNYEISQQGFEQCYSETQRRHFLITPAELAQLRLWQKRNT